MGNNIVLNNASIDRTNFHRSDISGENTACCPDIVNMAAGAVKNSSGSPVNSLLHKNPLLKMILSVFHSLFFAFKVIILSAMALTYFVAGAFGGILYLIFYEKLFKTFLISLEKKNQKSPYYYKWKKHHLELNYEA